jgi:two-component sensor histidine kinase
MPYGAEFRSGLNVLFVDDDEALGALVARQLGQRGHFVVRAPSGDAAIERLAAGGIDVVALDNGLPGEDGFDILERIGSRGARPPVVFVTGDADARTAVAALRAGADDYIVKDSGPEFFELLIAGIEQVYERWRLKKIHDDKEREAQEARERAETLLQEVNHRVANSLGLVAAMVRLKASAVSDPAAAQALLETQARITAIGGVHRRLYMHNTIGLVALDDYLRFLTEELQTTLQDPERKLRIALTAECLTTSTDKAVSIGVIVGELVTNAFKYAYPEGEGGEVRVSMRAIDDGFAELRVEDDGVGFDVESLALGTGLGSRILKSMAVNLEAEIKQASGADGTRTLLRFALAGRPFRSNREVGAA